MSALCLITTDHYCCAHPGPVNAAGDTLRSLAESHGHLEVIKYLDDHSADSAGEGVGVSVFVWPLCMKVLDHAFTLGGKTASFCILLCHYQILVILRQ